MISAIVLAAGMSKRMGRSKLNLPWESSTVIGKVIETLLKCEIDEVIIVTGASQAEVLDSLVSKPVRIAYNPRYAEAEMLVSFQCGLKAVNEDFEAVMICLGDQPQMDAEVVNQLIQEYKRTRNPIIVPSYNHRRGHPWILNRQYWQDVLDLDENCTLRDFLNHHQNEIQYLNVTSPSVLYDLDTPEDYEQHKPKI